MKSKLESVSRVRSKLSDRLIGKLQNKEYRDAYMDEQVRTWIARQVRVMREQRGWSQKEMAERSGKSQSVISRLEDPDYGKVTLQTLLDLRAVFDVGLEVRFMDFGTALDRAKDVSAGAMTVDGFDIDQLTGPRFTANSVNNSTSISVKYLIVPINTPVNNINKSFSSAEYQNKYEAKEMVC